MDDSPSGRRERFQEYLEELTRAEGILRSDLLDLLGSKLDELRAVWGIKLDNGIDAARKTVRARLYSYIGQLEIRPGRQKKTLDERAEQYRHAIAVSFNIFNYPELHTMNLQERRAWLSRDERGKVKIAASTGQEDLKHAITQIADIMAGSGDGTSANNHQPEQDNEPAESQEEPANPEPIISLRDQQTGSIKPTALPASQSPRSISRPKALALLAVAAVLAIAVVTFVVYDPFRTAAGPSDTSGGSGPVPVPASSPLVTVANVTGMDSLDGDLRFVTPTPTTMTTSQLASFNSDVILKSANFSPWYASHGAVPVDVGVATITLRGSTSETVRITNIEAVKDCKAPYTGTIFTGYTQGGPSGTVKIGMNLDEPQPVARELAVTSEGLTPFGPGYFLANTLDVAPGDLTTITLGAFTKHYSCSFRLRLTIVTSRGSFYQDIDDAGRPFDVTAEAPAAKAGYPDSGYQTAYAQGPSRRWSAVDPQTYQGP